MKFEELKQSIADFPTRPGVYIMKDSQNRIIYVGKAKNLRNRVRSYFATGKDIKTATLVKKINSIDFVVTANQYEALILENNLIKENTPRYNINLKDGKTYPVIRITADDYPRVFRTRRIIRDGSDYFGPFADVKAIDNYLSIIDNLYPLRKCKGKLRMRDNPCLYYHIGKCPGPCAGKISKEDYGKQVDSVRALFTGDPEAVRTALEAQMQSASSELHFERAAEIRDSIRALDNVQKGQLVNDFDPESRDYLGFHEYEGLLSFVVFQMRRGRLVATDIFRSRDFGRSIAGADTSDSDTSGRDPGDQVEQTDESLTQFIIRYYEEFGRFPVRIFVPASSIDAPSLEQYFLEEFKVEIKILEPEETRDQRLLNMAAENARQDSFKRAREIGDDEGIRELQRVFKLPKLPRRIEGYDIAQLHGKHTVAAMVSFLNGVPDKKEYRHFNIRSLKGKIDDYGAMREAVSRRYTRLLNEKRDLPDLIVIDGGKGQLNAACEILESIGLRGIPIMSLAKRDEEVFLPGRSEGVLLPEGTPALRVLQAVRDESHRFGTTLNQKQRTGDLNFEANAVPGLGSKRSRRILVEFTSYAAAVEAGSEEIARRAEIPQAVAERFVEYFTQTPDEADQTD